MKRKEILKNLFVGFIFVLLLFVTGCSSVPKPEVVEEQTRENVEKLFTEDNNDDLILRLDEYSLVEQPNDLTYKGYLKGTAFYNTIEWDDRLSKVVQLPDSTNLVLDVTVEFLNKKYNQYTILIKENN